MADCSKLLQRINVFLQKQNISWLPDAGKLSVDEINKLIYNPAYVVNSTEKVKSLRKFITDVKDSKIKGKDGIIDYLKKKIDFSNMAVSKRNFEISTKKSELSKNMALTEYNTFSLLYNKLNGKWWKPTIKVANDVLEDVKTLKEKSDKFKKSLESKYIDKVSEKEVVGVNLSKGAKEAINLKKTLWLKWDSKFLSVFDSLDIKLPKEIKTAEQAENFMNMVKWIREASGEKVLKNWMLESHNKTLLSNMDDSFVELDIKTPRVDEKYAMNDVYTDYVRWSKKLEESWNMINKYWADDISRMKEILENSWHKDAKLYLFWGSIKSQYAWEWSTKWFFLVERWWRSYMFPVGSINNFQGDMAFRKQLQYVLWWEDVIGAAKTSEKNMSTVLWDPEVMLENSDLAVKSASEEKWNEFVRQNFWDYHDYRNADNRVYKAFTHFVTNQEKIKHMLPVLNDWIQEYMIRAKENFEWIFKWLFNESNRTKYLADEDIIKFKDDVHSNRNYYNLFFTLHKMFPEKIKQLESLWTLRSFYDTTLKWMWKWELLESVRKFLIDKWMPLKESTELMNKYDAVTKQIDHALNWEIIEWLVTMRALYSIALDDWAAMKWRWIFQEVVDKTTDMIIKTYDKWFAVSWDTIRKEIEKIVKNYFTEWDTRFNLAHSLAGSFESLKLLDSVQTGLKSTAFKDKLWFKTFQDLLTETFWNDWKRIYREIFKDETAKLPWRVMRQIRQLRYVLATSYTGSWAYIAAQNIFSWLVEWTNRWKLAKNSFDDFTWFMENLRKLADSGNDTILKWLLDEIWYDFFTHDVLTNWIQKTMEVSRKWWMFQIQNRLWDAYYHILTKLNKDVSPLKRQKAQAIIWWWFIPRADKLVEATVVQKSLYNLVLWEKNISVKQLNEFLDLYKRAATDSEKKAVAWKIVDILSSAKREANYRYSQFYTSWINRWLMKNHWSKWIYLNMFTSWSSKKLWQYFYNWLMKTAMDAYHINKRYWAWKSLSLWMEFIRQAFLNDHIASQFIAMVNIGKYGSKLMLDDEMDSKSARDLIIKASPVWQAANALFITHALEKSVRWYNQAREQWKDFNFSVVNWAKDATYVVLSQMFKDVKLITNAINAYTTSKTRWLNEEQAGRVVTNQILKRAMNNVVYQIYDIYQWIQYEKSNLTKASWLLDFIVWEPITKQNREQRDWIDRVYWESSFKEWDTVWTLVSQMFNNTKDSFLFWSLNVRNQNAMILLDMVKENLWKDWTYMWLVNNDVSWLSEELKIKLFDWMLKWRYRNNFKWIEWDDTDMDKMWNNAALILNNMAWQWIDINKFVKLLTSDALSDKMEAGLILRAVNNTEAESAVVLSYYMNTLYEAFKKEYKDNTWAKKLDDDVLNWIKVRVATMFWPLMLQLDKSQKNDIMLEYITEAYPVEDKALWDWEKTSAKRALTLQLMAADLDAWEAERDKSRFNNIGSLMLQDIPDESAPKTIWEYFDWIDTQTDIWDETKSVMKAGILYWNRKRLMKLFTDEEFRKKAESWLIKLSELIRDTDERLQTSDDMWNFSTKRWWVSKIKTGKLLDTIKDIADNTTKMRDTIKQVAPWIASQVISQRLNKSEMPDVKFNPLPTLDEQKEIDYKAKLREITTKPILTEWLWTKKSKPVPRRVAYKIKKLVRKPWT